jgi:OFA family oxalate/formate antiporter-like MFS transporter
MAQVDAAAPLIERPPSYRWVQLFLGIVCMVMIANLQYGWTLFVNPISDKFGWSKAAIQVAFTIFVLFETWLVPFEGYLVDRFGPRPVVFVGGLLCMIGWVINAYADTLMTFYVAAAISGTGAGAVYGTSVGNALKWFPDRRGLAAGLTAAGFGAGSALTVLPISAIIKTMGFQTAFLYFGIGQGIVVMLIALGLTDPRRVLQAGFPKTAGAAKRSARIIQTARLPAASRSFANRCSG